MHEFWVLGKNAYAQALAYSLWNVGHTVYLVDEDGAAINKMRRMSGFPLLNECFFDETMNISSHLDGIGYCDGIILSMSTEEIKVIAKKLKKVICPKVGLMYVECGPDPETGKSISQILHEELEGTPIIGLKINGTPDEIVSKGNVDTVVFSDSLFESNWVKRALGTHDLDIRIED